MPRSAESERPPDKTARILRKPDKSGAPRHDIPTFVFEYSTPQADSRSAYFHSAEGSAAEARLACSILKHMTALGGPASLTISR
jgi:hypothetical protein